MGLPKRLAFSAGLLFFAGEVFVACGDSGSKPSGATSSGGGAASGPSSAASGGDASTNEGGKNGGTGGGGGQDGGPAKLSPRFFSMTTNTRGASHVPSVPFGGLRLWDTTAVWPLIETDAGVYDFSELDAWLAEAKTAGVDVMFTFGRTPTWASADASSPCTYGHGCSVPPSDLGSGDNILKDFTTALVQHSLASMTTHIKYYEIWNEPDLLGTWSGTPGDLAKMGKDIADVIHHLDPDALVVGPSPSTGNKYGIHFLPDYYDAGGAPFQDIVGMHAYVYSGANFATAPEGVVDIIDQLKLLKTQNGIEDKPIIFTEGSWGDATNNENMTSDQKIAYVARDYLFMWMNGVDRFYWYAWDNAKAGQLADGGAIEPAGTAYGILESWLVGSSHADDNCAQDAALTWTCSLKLANGQAGLILWNPSASPSVAVPAQYTQFFTLDDLTSHPITGNAVTASAKPILLRP